MKKFNGKIFNPNVFEKYLRTLPSTKVNSLINNALFTNVNKYKSKMSEQAGGYFVTEPIKGRIGGTPVNYDGNTDIPEGVQRDTFFQTKICYGRAMSWGEDDFTVEITGENFKAEAGEVKEYWDDQRQATVLAILSGIFGMTDTVGKAFADKHTYTVEGNLDADTCNKAAQKGLGDAKQKLEVMFMHSAVSTNLEGLNLIQFLKYTDSDGIERDLTIGTYNGKLVIVDDDMPVTEVEADEEAGTEAHTEYTTYMFKRGFFEYENLGVKVPSEVARNAYKHGGRDELISRIREMIVPTLISYKTTTKISPLNEDFANGANWELVNNGETQADKKVYVDDKLIPVVRIISRG